LNWLENALKNLKNVRKGTLKIITHTDRIVCQEGDTLYLGEGTSLDFEAPFSQPDDTQ
jgi:hypothetical protein